MGDPLRYPKLRWPIDLRLQAVENEKVLIVSCPSGIAPQPLVLTAAVAPLVSCLDGSLSRDEILAKFAPQGLQSSLLDELVELLDKNLFLATPRFFSAERAVQDNFLNSSVRQAALAGGAYAKEPGRLTQEIDGYLAHQERLIIPEQRKLLCLVSPHIDYRRGGIAYGKAWNFLRSQTHDTYIVIGTSHQYSPRLFHLTRKGFETPLGVLPTHQDFVTRLSLRYGVPRSFADEFLHRREHSLELQLPFLARLKQTPTIVPILVGGFHQILVSGKSPSMFDEYESFAGALAECVSHETAAGRTVCFIAGVDMAHVGQSFGDQGNLTPEFMEKIGRRDHEYLESIRTGDKNRMFAHIAEDSDARRICGFPTMYLLLDVFERLGLRYDSFLFDYRQAVDYKTDCAVTFAGMGLYHV